MTAGEILCAGRVYCDLVFADLPRMPSLGTEVFAGDLSLHAGGGPLITAAALRVLGRPAGLLATLPAAPFDAPVREAAAAFGIGMARTGPAAPGTAPQITVAMAAGADRAFLSRAAGAALSEPEDLRGVRHLHVGELRSLAEHPLLLDLARAAGASVSLDCGWDDALDAGAAALVAAVDLFLPNEEEAARIAALGGAMPEHTVVKMGAAGARRGDLVVPAAPVRAVDTTGAGDAFDAGYLDAWLSGASVAACLSAGNRCGAAAVARPGGTDGLRDLPAFASAAE